MHVYTHILSLQQRKLITRTFRADLHEQTAATRFIWTIVILSSIEASGPLLNRRTLKMAQLSGV